MKKFLRLLPIEIYALGIPSFVTLSGFLLWRIDSAKQVGFTRLVEKLNYIMSILGNSELEMVFVFFWLLVGVYLVLHPVVNYKKTAVQKSTIVPAVKSLAAITVFYNLMALMFGISLSYLFYLVSGARVLQSTLAVDKLERLIFGVLPAVRLIYFLSGTLAESVILYTYLYLFFLALCSGMIALAFLNKDIFRRTIVAFFLSCVISVPLFAAIPVISPDGLYIAKVFKTSNVAVALPDDFRESKTFSSFNDFFHTVWISSDNGFYAVSSIPSLHAAWGLIMLLGILKTRKKILAGIFSLWFVFNTIGTFYSLQHYALDTVAGLVFGFAMFYLAGKLLELEKKYYKGKDWYYFSEFLMNLRSKLGK